jgi:hypothetical protein
MKSPLRLTLAVMCGVLCWPWPARAGMAAPIDGDVVESAVTTGLTEISIARLQNLSFFMVGFLLSAFLIQLLWNWMRKDWTFLPRLNYGKALGVVFLWGLVFVLVLTMISGARELMTPGAWEKQGLTYRLAKPKPDTPETPTFDKKREEQLARLREALWKFANQREGQFPDDLATSGIAPEVRQLPDPSGMSYAYVKGLKTDTPETPLAFEPDIFGPVRLVLFTSGAIRAVKAADLQLTLPAETP